jgi:hypothetical protein
MPYTVDNNVITNNTGSVGHPSCESSNRSATSAASPMRFTTSRSWTSSPARRTWRANSSSGHSRRSPLE